MFELVRLSAFLCRTASLGEQTDENDNVRGAGERLILRQYLLENAIIHRYHDDAWYPEGDGTRHDGVHFVHDKNALARVVFEPLEMLVGRIPAEEDWGEGDEGWQHPNASYHESDCALRHVQRILQWTAYGKISKAR
jgi:hypothetical protein